MNPSKKPLLSKVVLMEDPEDAESVIIAFTSVSRTKQKQAKGGACATP